TCSTVPRCSQIRPHSLRDALPISLAVEALFFGQAGMLEGRDFADKYPILLQKEYAYLRKLHALSPIDGVSWKFMRTRPGNFPSIDRKSTRLNSSHMKISYAVF